MANPTAPHLSPGLEELFEYKPDFLRKALDNVVDDPSHENTAQVANQIANRNWITLELSAYLEQHHPKPVHVTANGEHDKL
jgi:hypothetical protein